ncbi:MAG: ABC transporter permease [Thermoplasmata archaeon]|nr:ABC transporter permease [Thermoplasmata archaeon]
MMLNFFLFRVMPNDPAALMSPRSPDIDTKRIYLENVEKFGLDKGLPEQFLIYLKMTFTGDWGISYIYKIPVLEAMSSALAWTALLLGISSILTFLIGMHLGKIAARRRGKSADVAITGFGLFFYGMPIFWFAIILMLVLAVYIPIFPTGGYITSGVQPFPLTFEKVGDMLMHLVLPCTTLVVGSMAGIILIMRNTLVDVLTEDYVTTAYAKGLTEKMVMKRHAGPNARLPIVTTIAMDTAFILGGAFQVEYVFGYKGIGWMTIDAINKSDYPLLQFIFLIGGMAVVFANLFADLAMVKLDPRVSIV